MPIGQQKIQTKSLIWGSPGLMRQCIRTSAPPIE
ncbi:hypothetical protein GGR00_000756 [Aminobacter aganoensis]|uniref:Uncharacterized protein n=1 Tax=Aminobacter aganoensis TaxID=83264 RepID=A0A7X0F4N2_9HYPH|nr:hypothetical protein [Aminobacter aganoensis]